MLGRRKTICVISNKGGVGKTVVSIGIARELAQQHKVMLLDLDLHGPDVLVRLGLAPSLADFTTRKVQPIPWVPNVWAFSADCLADDASHGYLAKDEDKRAYVRSSFKTLDFKGAKYTVCDMPAGTDEILYDVMKEIVPQHIVLVTNPEMASLLDTEKLINILCHYDFKDRILGLVENMAHVLGPNGERGHRFNNVSAKRGLCVEYDIPYLGGIPEYVDWEGNGKMMDRLYEHEAFKTIARMV
jgi:Mrp family chromosome partitioning ATPase